jgi:GTP cyclohydrolase II
MHTGQERQQHRAHWVWEKFALGEVLQGIREHCTDHLQWAMQNIMHMRSALSKYIMQEKKQSPIEDTNQTYKIDEKRENILVYRMRLCSRFENIITIEIYY